MCIWFFSQPSFTRQNHIHVFPLYIFDGQLFGVLGWATLSRRHPKKWSVPTTWKPSSKPWTCWWAAVVKEAVKLKSRNLDLVCSLESADRYREAWRTPVLWSQKQNLRCWVCGVHGEQLKEANLNCQTIWATLSYFWEIWETLSATSKPDQPALCEGDRGPGVSLAYLSGRGH